MTEEHNNNNNNIYCGVCTQYDGTHSYNYNIIIIYRKSGNTDNRGFQ